MSVLSCHGLCAEVRGQPQSSTVHLETGSLFFTACVRLAGSEALEDPPVSGRMLSLCVPILQELAGFRVRPSDLYKVLLSTEPAPQPRSHDCHYSWYSQGHPLGEQISNVTLEPMGLTLHSDVCSLVLPRLLTEPFFDLRTPDTLSPKTLICPKRPVQ